MGSAELTADLRVNKDSPALRQQLRILTRVATVVALLTAPAVYLTWAMAFHHRIWISLLLTIVTVLGFRGFIDVVTRRLIPWPSLYGAADARIQEADIVDRRRAWYWRRWMTRLIWTGVILGILFGIPYMIMQYYGWHINFHSQYVQAVVFQMVIAVFTMPILFFVNIIIIFGPLLAAGISQIKGFEPGDADWGVRLEDVRGQLEAKEEVRRVVTLWQSGELFEAAGGKRERGLLFHGPPGTGKTMLAKGLATSFNAPFIAMPGSGFAQTFIGLDVIIVRFMVRKAKRLARKWGGTCIVFIDEIDAVGMRRQSLGAQRTAAEALPLPKHYGPWGSLGPQGDVIVENDAWRDYIFEYNAPAPRSFYPPIVTKVGDAVNSFMPGAMGMGGGGLALNQLLIAMDGVDSPPFMKRTFTNWINTWLDVSYLIPRRAGRKSLRLRPPKPRKEQVYFIGATNVPLNALDPALMRPGRMGRHVWFRTPTKEDRKDIFDLYLSKVAHDPELDTDKRRDEIARITGGYSPARIEQVCSLALTYAHHNGRASFVWQDLIDAMSVIEAGAAYNVEYSPAMARSTAIHEAGHAAAAHVYRPELESSRLSIRMRADSFGHHLAREREETFGLQWQSESFGDLIHILGAMAAELVFYGQTGNGVGGDLTSVTNVAAFMVGTAGMAPKPIPVASAPKGETIEQVQEKLAKRAEHLGLQLLNRTRSGGVQGDPIAAILGDAYKREAAAQIAGQAFVIAYNFIRLNENKVERVAEVLLEKQEIYGDELTGLLDAQKFEKPEIDWTKDESWPPI